MNFNEALECLKDGKKMRRLGFGVIKYIVKFTSRSVDQEGDTFFMAAYISGDIKEYRLSAEDVFADDWDDWEVMK